MMDWSGLGSVVVVADVRRSVVIVSCVFTSVVVQFKCAQRWRSHTPQLSPVGVCAMIAFGALYERLIYAHCATTHTMTPSSTWRTATEWFCVLRSLNCSALRHTATIGQLAMGAQDVGGGFCRLELHGTHMCAVCY